MADAWFCDATAQKNRYGHRSYRASACRYSCQPHISLGPIYVLQQIPSGMDIVLALVPTATVRLGQQPHGSALGTTEDCCFGPSRRSGSTCMKGLSSVNII